MSEPSPVKKRVDPLSAVAIIVVLAILGANAWKAKHPPSTPTVQTTESDASAQIPENVLPGKTVASDFLFPTAFQQASLAEQTINQTQGKTGAGGNLEQIVYGIVKDPVAADTFYFATSSNNPESNFVGIYRYKSSTHHWNRLYKHTFTATNGAMTRLHVVGIQGGDLIITEDHLGDLLDPCASPLLLSLNLSTLSLINANDELKPFTLSDEARMAEEAKETACKK